MIPPISILDQDFEKAVDLRVSAKAKASEMEHAARYHIRKHFNEDPVYYQKLSEKLEEILADFAENWDDLIDALHGFTHDVREGRQADDTGLDPQTQAPFYDVILEGIKEAGEAPDQERKADLALRVIEIVEHVSQEIGAVDFWRNAHAQSVLRKWLVVFLDDNNILPFKRLEKVADRLMELAKAKHARLVA
jgi:type I restriction enzyme R subunit